MSRLRRIAESDRIFFVTTNLAKSVRSLTAEERDLLLAALDTLRASCDFLLLGYVIMPEHAHLLVACRMESISKLMHQWKFKPGTPSRSGEAIMAHYGNHGISISFVGGAATFPTSSGIHENPVTAGLSRHDHEWRWSSGAHYARIGIPPVIPDFMEFSGDPNELLWPAPWHPA